MKKTYGLAALLLALLAAPGPQAVAQGSAPASSAPASGAPASALPAELPDDSLALVALGRRPGLGGPDRARLLEAEARHHIQSDPALARTMLRQALALVGPAPTDLRLQVLLRLSDAAHELADVPAAQAYAAQALALALARPGPPPALLPETYLALGQAAALARDPRGGHRWFEQALAAFDAQEPALAARNPRLPNLLSLLLPGYFAAGQPARAGAAFRRALALLRRYPQNPVAPAYLQTDYADGLRAPHPDSAAYFLGRAAALAAALHDPGTQVFVATRQAALARQQQDWPAMLRHVRLARRLLATRRAPPNARDVEVLADIALALRRTGQGAAAYDTLRLSATLFDTIFSQRRRQEMARFEGSTRAIEQRARIRELGLRNAAAAAQGRLQQRLLGAGGAALLAVLALAAVLFNRYRLKQRTAAALEIKNAEISKRDAEKAILLREMHHRVKNNLQVVSSLLSLQGRQLADAGARDALRESRSRVEAMALLHQKLYQDEDALRHVALPDYVRLLVATVLGAYGHDPAQVATLDVADLAADVEVALPLGLLLNELLTNACKYALPHAAGPPRLALTLRPDGPGLRLTLADNGPGLPPEATAAAPTASAAAAAPAEAARGFGRRLLGLLTEQLEGTLAWAEAPGGGAVAEVFVPRTSLATTG